MQPRAGQAAVPSKMHPAPADFAARRRHHASEQSVRPPPPPLCSVPGVVELCGTADDAANVYLVFEPCLGGDLYKRLAHKGLLSEAQLCKEVRHGQMRSGVAAARERAARAHMCTAGAPS